MSYGAVMRGYVALPAEAKDAAEHIGEARAHAETLKPK